MKNLFIALLIFSIFIGCSRKENRTEDVFINSSPEMCEVGGMLVLQWASIHTNEEKSKIMIKKIEDHALQCENCKRFFNK